MARTGGEESPGVNVKQGVPDLKKGEWEGYKEIQSVTLPVFRSAGRVAE
jgi:hypothetical protein